MQSLPFAHLFMSASQTCLFSLKEISNISISVGCYHISMLGFVNGNLSSQSNVKETHNLLLDDLLQELLDDLEKGS